MSFRRRRSSSSRRHRNIRIDATEELANILLSSGRGRHYDDILDLIPYADLNSKVVTREDEYTPVGRLSIDWDLPGEKSLFEAFIQYEYLPIMADIRNNPNRRNMCQNVLDAFKSHGAQITSCHPEITSFVEDLSESLDQTIIALDTVKEICLIDEDIPDR